MAKRSAARHDTTTVGMTEVFPNPGVLARLGAVVVRLFARPVINFWAHHPALPWPFGLVDLAAVFLPAVRGVERVRVTLPKCEAEYTRPAHGGTGDGAILYLHGGAWLVGGLRSHRRLVSRLVRDTGLPALAVNYRKLPNASITDGLDDCLDGYRRLLDSGVPGDLIAVVGDSAGGYYALQVALQARRAGLGSPGAVACISPLVDLEPTSKLAGPNATRDPLFPPKSLDAIWDAALAAENDPASAIELLRFPVTAPAADLAALPPTLIQVGGGEMLRPDSEGMADRIVAAGGNVRIQVFPGQVHVFQVAADVLPEARTAVAALADHIRTHISTAARRAA